MSIQTHDYTKRGWGHDYTFDTDDKGLTGRMMGWGYGLKDGDYLILQNGDRGSRYRILHVEYLRHSGSHDGDMWKAEVEFAPRQAEAPERAEANKP